MKDKTKNILWILFMIAIVIVIIYGASQLGHYTFHKLNPGVNDSNFDPWKAYNCSVGRN